MKEFRPTRRYDLDQFFEEYELFRFKIISSKLIRAEYYYISNHRHQLYRLISGSELETFRSCIGYHYGIRHPEQDREGEKTGYYTFNPDIKPYQYQKKNNKQCRRKKLEK